MLNCLRATTLPNAFINTNLYDGLIKPKFSPPGFLFPIVWTILYILMGYSSYLIYSDNAKNSVEIAYGIDNIEQGHLLEGVVSRKKQMVPVIMDVFSN